MGSSFSQSCLILIIVSSLRPLGEVFGSWMVVGLPVVLATAQAMALTIGHPRTDMLLGRFSWM